MINPFELTSPCPACGDVKHSPNGVYFRRAYYSCRCGERWSEHVPKLIRRAEETAAQNVQEDNTDDDI